MDQYRTRFANPVGPPLTSLRTEVLLDYQSVRVLPYSGAALSILPSPLLTMAHMSFGPTINHLLGLSTQLDHAKPAARFSRIALATGAVISRRNEI